MNQHRTEVDDRCLMLPWYVNETLNAGKRKQVEAHLQDCASCADELRALRQIAKAVSDESTAPLIPEAPVDEFMRRLDDTSEVTEKRHSSRQWAIAAALVIAIAAALLLSIHQPSVSPNEFETVTDNAGTAHSYVFQVEFEAIDIASAEQVLLDQVPGAVVSPSETGYRLVVEMPPSTIRELDEYARSLQLIDGVDSVTLTGVQLPVE